VSHKKAAWEKHVRKVNTKYDLQLEGGPEEIAAELSDALENRLHTLLQDYGYDDDAENLPSKMQDLTTADMRQILRDNEILESALALDKEDLLPDPTPEDFEGLRDAVMSVYQTELMQKGKPATGDLATLKQSVELLRSNEARLEKLNAQNDANATKE